MSNEGSKINFEKRPIPSGPGAQQITVMDQVKSMKGGAPFVSKLPEKGLVKGPSSSKPGA